jgi:zinc protease
MKDLGPRDAGDSGMASPLGDRQSKDGAPRASGVKVTLVPSGNSPLIHFRILFQVGSIDDPPGKEGLVALTAQMMVEGGTRSLSYLEVLDALYPLAARIGARADKEVVVITGECHRDHVDRFYPIFRDAILEPRFDPQDFSRLRDEAVNGLVTGLTGNDDENLGKWALQLSIYANHPYGHVDSGTVQGLMSLTLEEVRQCHKCQFTRERVEIGLGGGYPPELVARISGDLGSRLGGGRVEHSELPSPRIPQGMEVLLVKKPCIATAISGGFPTGITRRDDDWYPLLVANSYLGEHRTFNGVLMKELRGKRGLNYGDYSYVENFVQEGGSTFPVTNIPRRQQYFSFWLRPVPHENALFALRAALFHLDKLVREGISEEDFQQTKSFLISYSRLWARTLDQRLGYLQDSEFYGVGDYLAEVRARLGRTTCREVNEAIRNHLRATGVQVVMVTEDAEGALHALESGAPTPIHYDPPGTPPSILEEDRRIESFPMALNRERSRIVAPEQLFER